MNSNQHRCSKTRFPGLEDIAIRFDEKYTVCANTLGLFLARVLQLNTLADRVPTQKLSQRKSFPGNLSGPVVSGPQGQTVNTQLEEDAERRGGKDYAVRKEEKR